MALLARRPTAVRDERSVRRRLADQVGGPARLRVIVLLAAVLGLQGADTSTVGAAATQLESGLRIGNTQLGLLVTVSIGTGALATLPCGLLVDRVNRVRLLGAAIVVWSAALVVCGAAQSFSMLLATRLALGVVIAVAGPAVASLVGDLFPPRARGRLYGFILAGELLGGGLGFLVAGNVAAAISWRWAFWVMVLPSLAVAWAMHRYLPEPARGGASELQPGDDDLVPATALEASTGRRRHSRQSADRGVIERQIERSHIEPVRSHVLVRNPAGESLWWAIRYVLKIRTNVVLIAASAFGYFLSSGVRTFGVVFVRDRFDVTTGMASSLLVALGAGSVLGVLCTGRIADALITRCYLPARPVVAGISFVLAALLFAPALLVGSLVLAAPLFFVAAAAIGGTNPPLDAARLDLMPGRLWGRAEAVRTVLRSSFEALAPLAIGWLSSRFGGHTSGFGHPTASGGGTGLRDAFLLLLVPVAAAGVLLLVRARRTYPRDVATALASDRATSG